MSKFIDISGFRFGSLVVAERSGSDRGSVSWKCRCDCGVDVRVDGYRLRSGVTRSCGCLQREFIGGLKKRHGKCGSPTYFSWNAMKNRCLCITNKDYPLYGGRGVRVCEAWLVFENFLADMGERPFGTSIDRIDPWGNYQLDNCRWATRKQQAQNRRKYLHRSNHGNSSIGTDQ